MQYLKSAHLSKTAVIFCFSLAALPVCAANLVANGNFSTNSCSVADGQLTVNNCSVTSWTGTGVEGKFGSQTTPPVFLFPAADGSTGVTGDTFMGTISFYGGSALKPPSGSYFIAADGDPAWHGGIKQTVSGLTAGDTYQLTFNWAGAQQQGYSGATTEKWTVSLGAQTESTSVNSLASQSFNGWTSATMDFTATSGSEVLNFLAVGSPSGLPPWLLINDIDLAPVTSAVPEPMTSGLLLIAALFGLPAAHYLRKRANRNQSEP